MKSSNIKNIEFVQKNIDVCLKINIDVDVSNMNAINLN